MLTQSTNIIQEIFSYLAKLQTIEISNIIEKCKMFAGSIILPFKSVLEQFHNEFDEIIKKLNKSDKKEVGVLPSEYKDKMQCFILGSKNRFYTLLAEFVIICIVYLAIGIYSINFSNNFYKAIEYSLNVSQASAYRLPYMTIMISAMRTEMLNIQQLTDSNGSNIYNSYYTKFKQNEIDFSKYMQTFRDYYKTEVSKVNEIETSNVCSSLLGDTNESGKEIIVECLNSFQGLLRFGMKTGINSLSEYIASSVYKIREADITTIENTTQWVTNTCNNKFFLNISKFVTQLISTQFILSSSMKGQWTII